MLLTVSPSNRSSTLLSPAAAVAVSSAAIIGLTTTGVVTLSVTGVGTSLDITLAVLTMFPPASLASTI